MAERIGTDRSTYRIVSLGLPPAVAQYNGFFTLDSYQYDYPLEYKHRFRRIIAPELAKSDAIRIYFDHWGNRCYAFAAQLGRDWMVGKDRDRVVTDLAFDLAALREMGGRYILSALPVLNHASLGLTLRGSFTDEAGYWNIWVYEVRWTVPDMISRARAQSSDPVPSHGESGWKELEYRWLNLTETIPWVPRRNS